MPNSRTRPTVTASIRHGFFGAARWYPANVATSSLCPDGCSIVTGNTVYQNYVMGLYIPTGTTAPHTYLATIPGK